MKKVKQWQRKTEILWVEIIIGRTAGMMRK